MTCKIRALLLSRAAAPVPAHPNHGGQADSRLAGSPTSYFSPSQLQTILLASTIVEMYHGLLSDKEKSSADLRPVCVGKGSQYNILNTATATNRRVELLSCTVSVISGVRVQANSKLQRPNQVTIIRFFFSLASAPRFPLLCVFSFLRSAITKQESLWRLDDLRPRHVFPIELQLHSSCLAPSLYRICPLVIQYTREKTQVSQALLIGSPPQLIDGTAGRRRLVISYHCFQLSFLILFFPSTDISAAWK